MAPTKAVPAVDPTTLLADLDVQRARVAARLETVADTITAFRTRGAEIKTETDGRKRAALRAGEDADVASLEAERTAGEVAIIELTRERGQIVMTERELEQDRLGIYREHHEAFLELAAEAVTVGNQLLGELMAAATPRSSRASPTLDRCRPLVADGVLGCARRPQSRGVRRADVFDRSAEDVHHPGRRRGGVAVGAPARRRLAVHRRKPGSASQRSAGLAGVKQRVQQRKRTTLRRQRRSS